MERLTSKERSALRKIGSKGGKTASGNLTPEERKAKARAAGLASGKARRMKAGKK